MKKVVHTLESISPWEASVIGEKLQDVATAEDVKFGTFFMMLRVALSGKKITPPLNESMQILGKEECITRIKHVI